MTHSDMHSAASAYAMTGDNASAAVYTVGAEICERLDGLLAAQATIAEILGEPEERSNAEA